MKWIKNLWPIGLLILVELILFAANYHPLTYLAGWDGLYPEFNFPINLQRNIFAVWQEYRGVGLYDGMSYASNLVHTLFIWLLSFVLPQHLLRYFFIFFMHGLGMVGMYFLLKKLFLTLNSKLITLNIIALLGSLFYGLNIGIIQLFYAPLEVFAIHFAFLPILILGIINYLQAPTRKNLFFFTLFSFLATPQGFVLQIFISYLLAVFSLLGVFLIFRQWGKEALKQCLTILVTIFCMNAFWLLPYVYGIPQNAPIIMNSKINQMASPTIYQMNQNRGNLFDVLTLKGFMLDTAEFSNNQYGYIMQAWRSHVTNPLFVLPSLLFVTLMLYGIFSVLTTKQAGLYPFVIISGICFFFLGNDVWGLNVLNALLRFLFPIFNEAFRFPFTKFETLFAFSYTILLTYGLIKIFELLGSEKLIKFSQRALARIILWRKNDMVRSLAKKIFISESSDFKNNVMNIIAYVLLFIALFFYSLPAFAGHFFFDSVRVVMEPEYTQLIQYLNTQPQTSRIATLPQPTFYNWEYHANNYRGSGFLWYGIPQATLERSFDPWSAYNENYYWELSQALYSHNADNLKSVFSKYQVQYLLVDENQTYPLAQNSLQIQQTKDILSRIGVKTVKKFGKVTLYSLPASPLFVADNLPTVNSYQWTDNDTFYQLHGDYIAQADADFILPFRSLFTNRPNTTFTLSQDSQKITLSAMLPANTSHITLPAYTTFESFIPAVLSFNKDTHSLSFFLQTPTVILGNQPLLPKKMTYSLGILPDSPSYPLTIQVNNQPPVTLLSDHTTTLGTYLLPVRQNTIVAISDSQKGHATTTVPFEKIQQTFSQPLSISLSTSLHGQAQATQNFPITVTIPKTNSYSLSLSTANIGDCTTLTDGKAHLAKAEFIKSHTLLLSAARGDACLSFFDRQAQSNQGYLLSLKSTNISGDPLTIWAEDPSESFSFLNTRLSQNRTGQESDFILPPREDFNLGYSFHIENNSLGDSFTRNEVSNVSLSPIPYAYLTHIMADSGKNPHAVTTHTLHFTHPNPSIYDVTLDFAGVENPTLMLSQAFDPGWHAYVMQNSEFRIMNVMEQIFPFILGTELKNHVKGNNWENGWQLNQSSMVNGQSSIVLLFLPQYLEYLGFGIMGIFISYFGVQSLHSMGDARRGAPKSPSSEQT